MSPGREVCRFCGAELVADADFCDQCGASVGAGDAPGATPLCPKCGHATERAGAAAERLSSPPPTQGGRPETEAEAEDRQESAGWLSRPEEPRAFSLFGWTVVLLVPFLNVLSLFVAPFTLGLKLFMGVVGVVYVGVGVWYVTGTFTDPFAARDAAMMTGFTTFALYFVALVHSWRVERRDVRDRRAPAWRRSAERWEHMVHCDRCGTVFFDDDEGAPVPLEKAGELLGRGEWEERADTRTPLWLWMVLAAMAVGGGRVAVSMARQANVEPEPLAPASPEMWEDIEADPVRLDSTGGQEPPAGEDTELEEPLLGPGSTPPDTARE